MESQGVPLKQCQIIDSAITVLGCTTERSWVRLLDEIRHLGRSRPHQTYGVWSWLVKSQPPDLDPVESGTAPKHLSRKVYRPEHPEDEIVQYAEQRSLGVVFKHHAFSGRELGLTHDNLARLAIVSGLEQFNRALVRELEK